MDIVWQGQTRQGCSNCASLFLDPKQNKALVSKAKSAAFNAHVIYRTTRSGLRHAADRGCPLCFELLSLYEAQNGPFSRVVLPLLQRHMARTLVSSNDECKFDIRMSSQKVYSSRSRTVSRMTRLPALLVAVRKLLNLPRGSGRREKSWETEVRYTRGRGRASTTSRQRGSGQSKV